MDEERKRRAAETAEDLIGRVDNALDGSLGVWRLALSDAVVELFGKGKAVTPASLIACMEKDDCSPERRASRERAIEKLRVFV